MEGIIIYGSCFSHEIPDTKIFPQGIKNITFINCNLDNVFIVKPDWITVNCTQKRFKVQADARDWEIDSNGKPIKVIGEKDWVMQGYSVDPLDIPVNPTNKIVMTKSEFDTTFAKGEIPQNSAFIEIPKIVRSWTDKHTMITKKDSVLEEYKNISIIVTENDTKMDEYNLRCVSAEIDMVEVEGRVMMLPIEQLKKVI